MTGIWIPTICIALLMLAAISDARHHRIPNRLILAGMLLGLAANTAAAGLDGLRASAAGLGVGLAVFLPFYFLRALGAGDVKLFAMVGSLLGIGHLAGVVFATLIAGGVLGLALAWRAGRLRETFGNLRLLVYGLLMRLAAPRAPSLAAAPTAVRMPYGVAIAVGTVTYLIWLQAWGGWL